MKERLTELLRELDSTQRKTDEEGGAEIAWYYYRDKIEDVMGFPRGFLDTEPRPRPETVVDVLERAANRDLGPSDPEWQTVVNRYRDANGDGGGSENCSCPHPADEHSVYGCAEGCACEWMRPR
jgi:hypothetical protein